MGCSETVTAEHTLTKPFVTLSAAKSSLKTIVLRFYVLEGYSFLFFLGQSTIQDPCGSLQYVSITEVAYIHSIPWSLAIITCYTKLNFSLWRFKFKPFLSLKKSWKFSIYLPLFPPINSLFLPSKCLAASGSVFSVLSFCTHITCWLYTSPIYTPLELIFSKGNSYMYIVIS